MQLQPHLDLTKMGVGVILDVEAKEDGVAKAALVRFEGGPRTGLWYSIGSLEHEPERRPLLPSPANANPRAQEGDSKPRFASSLGYNLASVRASLNRGGTEERDSTPAEPAPNHADVLEKVKAEVAGERDLSRQRPVLHWLDATVLGPLLRSRPESSPQERLAGFLMTPAGYEASSLCILLFARGVSPVVMTRWLRTVWTRFPDRPLAALSDARRALESRPLWRFEERGPWPGWLTTDGAEVAVESVGDSCRSTAGALLDERQLILRGWLFPGERMRVLLRELSRGVPGVETEREALTWIELRLRELGWWRPLQVRPFEPAFLSRNDLRNSVAEALPAATQAQLESLLRGAQRAGIVRSPAEAAAWLRAWVEVWISKTQPQPEPELPEALRAWDLIQRGWVLDSVRIRALLAKQERARERREPLYLQSPLAWAYCALAELGWLQPRRPSLKPLTLDRMPRVRPSQLSAELGAALRQAQSAGILRCDAELETYALAWIEENRARRLGEALEREDLGGALEALGGG